MPRDIGTKTRGVTIREKARDTTCKSRISPNLTD